MGLEGQFAWHRRPHRSLLSPLPEDTEPTLVAEINITPLTDIFLVLLIIFMVSSSVMNQSGMEVNLPATSSASVEKMGDGVVVTLLSNSRVLINREEVSVDKPGALEKALRGAMAPLPEADRVVILEGDRNAMLGRAVQVMDLAKRAGAQKIALSTASAGK